MLSIELRILLQLLSRPLADPFCSEMRSWRLNGGAAILFAANSSTTTTGQRKGKRKAVAGEPKCDEIEGRSRIAARPKRQCIDTDCPNVDDVDAWTSQWKKNVSAAAAAVASSSIPNCDHPASREHVTVNGVMLQPRVNRTRVSLVTPNTLLF